MKKIETFILIVMLFFVSAIPAHADSMIAPMPYEIDFEGQDLVFRMVPSDNYNWNQSIPEESGLYVKSTGEKIYTVSEYFYQELYFSADRMSFAAMTWQETNEDRGIVFCISGTMNPVRVTDLMKDLDARKYSVSHYNWEQYNERVYDEKNSTLSILTNDGIRYTFDINTGEIIQTSDENAAFLPGSTWVSIAILAIILIGSVLIIYFYWKRIEKK
ncbi:hypothetical protein [Methanimicrococcus hacksteinii]|nr:hypothetical protein [Methanimicrococcus sp. At1]